MAATASLSASASARRSSLMRYFRHPGFLIGVILLTLLLIVAVAAPWIAPMSPLETDLANTLAPPSAAHLLGTDQFGRDVLSRLIWGTRISLQVAVAVMALSLSLGMVIGAVAGFFGGWVERVTVSIIDILLAFPGFLLALALVAARGSSLESVIIAVALAFTPRVAAVMRAVVLTIKPRTYVEASRAIGMGTMRLLFLHVVPNSLPPVIVVATVSAATAILAEAGLSFLGLGVQPPAPTWGNVIADGQSFLASNPLISLSAGICIAVMVVALNLLGDGLRDTLDPQMRRSSGRVL
ncbi:ABC transporter permease [Azospirillum brasilense]|uniref:ABC transporter permease n=1 Tax=Azospirillum brasilense TaxID=192 RepID=A0A0P0EW21_AZOBR|nr:ABC transporter permease [Azospirillum brasilense]PWC90549.1 peptide ABC transporter permease [Azospirillum sp. Sp 7]ALJ38594.1 peptide ABC transporter permease [Azospirillum brasilense]QCO12034.1 ABC transporter permease [Azospirillum brasilense]QEL93165.1 ABC transporter permease [Azospirillum brasilense]QEL99486.1 ABC transporter permease [Azospirillum brasilense]